MEDSENIDRLDLQAVIQGNHSAFERLFRKYYKPLCDYARSILGNQDAAEDSVQEVFGYFWNKRHDIQVEVSIKSYLYSAVRHAALNHLRRQVTEEKHQPLLTEYLEYLEHTEYSEQEQKDIEIMKTILQTLPEQCRKVFLMSCLENKTYHHIAQELGISVNTVKTHISKAYRIIREKRKGILPLILAVWLAERQLHPTSLCNFDFFEESS